MANNIHATASIGKDVTMGESNTIGPGCVLADGAVLGSNNRLWMNVYIGPGTSLGDANQIHMGAVLGHEPQDLSFEGKPSFTNIGSRNTIREYVTVHRGAKEGTATEIGDDNFLMANTHIAHNCRVGSHVTMANLATLGGHCVIEDGVFISGLVVLHQFVRVGQLAILSGLSAINKDVPPYMLCGGRPAVIQGLNVVGLRRGKMGPAVREKIKQAYWKLYRKGLSVPHAIEAIEKDEESPEVQALVRFVKNSKRGICAGIGHEGPESEETLRPRKPSQNPA